MENSTYRLLLMKSQFVHCHGMLIHLFWYLKPFLIIHDVYKVFQNLLKLLELSKNNSILPCCNSNMYKYVEESKNTSKLECFQLKFIEAKLSSSLCVTLYSRCFQRQTLSRQTDFTFSCGRVPTSNGRSRSPGLLTNPFSVSNGIKSVH